MQCRYTRIIAISWDIYFCTNWFLVQYLKISLSTHFRSTWTVVNKNHCRKQWWFDSLFSFFSDCKDLHPNTKKGLRFVNNHYTKATRIMFVCTYVTYLISNRLNGLTNFFLLTLSWSGKAVWQKSPDRGTGFSEKETKLINCHSCFH